MIVRIITHLGLPARAPPRSPAQPLAVPGGPIRKAKAARYPARPVLAQSVKMRRHQPARANAGHEESTREGEFSPNTVRLTVCRASNVVADSQKRRLNFLFAVTNCLSLANYLVDHAEGTVAGSSARPAEKNL